jgi:hypothetical protein
MKRQIDSMKEYIMTNLGCYGGTSNIGQGMSPPMAPSMPAPMTSHIMTPMGPTSPPIYRPTPRPLYPDSSYVDP